MKKLLLMACMLLLSVTWVVAQAPTQETGAPPATQNQENQMPAEQSQQDQGTAGTADQTGQTETDAEAAGQLPQTASPLPLLALLGIGSLAAGYASRRK